jgi:hypothetical protein
LKLTAPSGAKERGGDLERLAGWLRNAQRYDRTRPVGLGFLVLSCQVAGLSNIDVRFAGGRIFRLLVGATTPFVIVLTCCFICAIRNRA